MKVPSRNDPLGLVTGGEAVITGTVVCGAAIAGGAAHVDDLAQLARLIGGSVFVYYLAHTHAKVLGSAVAHGHHPRHTVLAALRHEFPMLLASLLPLGVLALAALFGSELRNAAYVALSSTTLLLMVYSYFAAARSGLGLVQRVVACAAGGALGALLIVLKAFH